MTGIQLRPYQSVAVDSVLSALHSKHDFEDRENKSVGMIVPTGGGKTECFLEVTKRYREINNKKMVLILSHRDILTTQTADRCHKRLGFRPGVLQGMTFPRANDKVVVSTMQSACKENKFNAWKNRLKQASFVDIYNEPVELDVGLIVIDEMHYVGCDSYEQILGMFPSAKVFGVTATPFREGKIMTGLLDKIAYSISISELIEQGYLVKPVLESMYSEEHDNTIADVAARCLRIYEEREKDRCVVIYLKTMQDARICRNVFIDHGIPAEAVVSDSEKDMRSEVFDKFRNGEIKVLTTVNVLTEGFDAPNISAIFMPYKTSSPTMYLQRIGRGLRTQDGGKVKPEHWKQKCTIYYGGDRDPSISKKQWEKLTEVVIKGGKAKFETFSEEFDYLKMMGMDGETQFTWTQDVVAACEKLKELRCRSLSDMLNRRKIPDRFMNKLDIFVNAISEKPQFPMVGQVTDKQRDLLVRQGFDRAMVAGLSKEQACRLINGIASASGWEKKVDEKWKVPSGLHAGKMVWEVPHIYWTYIMKNAPGSDLWKFYMAYKGRNNG